VVPAILLALVPAACSGSGPPTPSPSASPATGTPDGTTGPGPGDDRQAFAVWPEDVRSSAEATADRVAAGELGWRRRPDAMAGMFAGRVLGWPGAGVEPFEDDGCDGCYLVTRADGGGAVFVRSEPLVGEIWSVVSVQAVEDGEIEDYRLAFSVSGGRARGAIDLGDEPGATLVLAYGERSAEVDVAPPGEFDLDLGFEPPTSGHFLVLFGEDGAVSTAVAGTLPAGDFAAS